MGRENVAITKLMHVKERKNGNPHGGMYDCIKYIIDPEKTENYWIGGNAGTKTDQVYQNFMETKREFQKLDGRQCYHFVISFRPGETDPVTAYNVAQEFCEKYLGNHYQYIFAVHTDHEHLHAHIVFNSVSIVDGIKYHYADGDWKKYIQPVTDSITVKYGLSPLTYEEKRKGMDYGAWLASKTKMGSLQEDIDYAIKHAATYQQFFRIMERKYKIRSGYSQKWQSEYLTFKNDKMPRGFRSYSLGKAYTVDAIKQRIAMKDFRPEKQLVNYYVPPVKKWTANVSGSWKKKNGSYLTPYQKKYMYYYWQIKKSERKFSGGRGVQKASRQAEEMLRCLRYIIREGIHGEEDLKGRRKQLRERKDYYEMQMKMTSPDPGMQEVKNVLTRYRYLIHYIETHNDDKVGTYENELDELEEKYPIDELMETEQRRRERNEETKEQLKRIKSEQMMLRKIRSNDKKRGIVL